MEKGKGIVLRTIPYGESSLILDIFTDIEGLQSFIISGVRKKTSGRAAVFQPMRILNIVYYPGKGDKLRRIKEAHIVHPYKQIRTEVVKTSVASLLIDFFRQSIREQERNDELFKFVITSFIDLDDMEEGMANYHIYFLIELCYLIGIGPENNFDEHTSIFSISDGKYVNQTTLNEYLISDTRLNIIFSACLKRQWSETREIPMDKDLRANLLELLVSYYGYHLENFKKPKSLEILKLIFA